MPRQSAPLPRTSLPPARLPLAGRPFADVDAFRDGIRGICGTYHVEPNKGGFRARAGLARLGGLEIATVALTARQICRDARAIRRDDADHFVLILQQQGEPVMRQDDRATRLRPGDMFLTDARRPSVFDFRDSFGAQLSVHLPRDVLQAQCGRELRGGVAFRREDSLCIAMTALLHRAQERDPPEIGQAFLSVLGTALGAADGQEAPGAAEDLLGQALEMIAARCRDPEFGPGVLADLLGISPRRLQRAFAALGQTPRERILATRLDRARQALALRGARTISDVAFDEGFGDLSHFYHSFRARFGHAPGAAPGSGPGTGPDATSPARPDA